MKICQRWYTRGDMRNSSYILIMVCIIRYGKYWRMGSPVNDERRYQTLVHVGDIFIFNDTDSIRTAGCPISAFIIVVFIRRVFIKGPIGVVMANLIWIKYNTYLGFELQMAKSLIKCFVDTFQNTTNWPRTLIEVNVRMSAVESKDAT